MERKVLYFGCSNGTGHSLYTSWKGAFYSADRIDYPYTVGKLDQGFLPKNSDRVDGTVYVTRDAGRLILAFWDRSVDSRGGSHSTFVVDGSPTYDEALAACKEAFPLVFSRLKFQLKAGFVETGIKV